MIPLEAEATLFGSGAVLSDADAGSTDATASISARRPPTECLDPVPEHTANDDGLRSCVSSPAHK